MAEPLDHALDLLKFSAGLVQSWITRFIVVNGALMSGVGAILSLQKDSRYAELLMYILLAICFLGMVSSIAMGGVILRQNAWHSYHYDVVRGAQGRIPLAPDRGVVTGGVTVTVAVWTMTLVSTLLWVSLFVAVPFVLR